eukprot:CAMPEP_0185183734 /NCGR_PEP_ID=MMETSP1140-20130426/2148_1 /TAXON_ID=298111 /ORGANISM="Pavlova sp., Strain CCMP459" /LENGTH=88 /DNA_ID=CAMNT_0027749759 /DNA_START=569 /DNA_END=835 /DNA_ORIENTATION=+
MASKLPILIWRLSSRNKDGNVVPIEQNLVQLGDASSLGGDFIFCHILKHHVHVVIEAPQCPHELLIALHDDPDARADALVDELEGQDL